MTTDSSTKPQRGNHGAAAAAAQSLIRKLTTEKAVKAHRQQTKEKVPSEADDITNIKLSSRGIKTIESLDLPALRFVRVLSYCCTTQLPCCASVSPTFLLCPVVVVVVACTV